MTPYTVWTLSKRSLWTLPSLLRDLWWIFLLLVLCSLLPFLYSTNLLSGILLTCIESLLAFYFSIYATIKSFRYWHNEKAHYTRISVQLLFNIFLLLMIIYCKTTTISLLAFLGVPLFLIDHWLGSTVTVVLMLPALLYFINRSLATYVLLFEGADISVSLNESKKLMNIEAWYSLTGPIARLSLIMILPVLVYFLASAYCMSGKGVDLLFSLFSLHRSFLEISIASFLYQLMSLLMINIMTGFYFDMKTRSQLNG